MTEQEIIDLYDTQVKAITNIAHTKWYKEIKNYWNREVAWIKALYPTVKEWELYKLQEKDKLATWFLTFLNNLESTQKVSEQAKV